MIGVFYLFEAISRFPHSLFSLPFSIQIFHTSKFTQTDSKKELKQTLQSGLGLFIEFGNLFLFQLLSTKSTTKKRHAEFISASHHFYESR
ncbi:hypothetical protein BA195_03060 [Tenacibaculum soleae]|uniref:Uncharacterized protein n=1 Tax=Tenacibaculum soleae TaxID=447689 RepID=A0A1B9Y1S2_9FLAO|nr:hypothetical protein BA195_03060 [Tenacibaculum soleae]